MKKRMIAIVTSLFLVGSMTAAFSGCNLFGRSADSSFAYDGAVADGYEGAESDWLASLNPPSTRERELYADAVASGSFSGSYSEFLQALGNGDPSDKETVSAALTSVVCVEASFRGSGTTSRGAGVFYSLDTSAGNAYIITNYHVIYSAETADRRVSSNISVYLYGNNNGGVKKDPISATFFGGAMDYDIAILQVTGSELLKDTAENTVSATAVVAGDSDGLCVGERVYAIGNPNGEGFSVSGGVVSVLSESIDILRADASKVISLQEIRTDAAVNHGNSGGGLFNSNGKLVGIVNARREKTEKDVLLYGFGYAIPVNLVYPLVENILANNGRAVCARLGITAAVADSKGIFDEETGKYYIEQKIVVNTIDSSGSGLAAGLQRNDTFLSFQIVKQNGEAGEKVPCVNLYTLTNLMLELRAGDSLIITLSRQDEIKEVTVPFNRMQYFAAIA